MVLAGFMLFAIGAADLVRQFVPRRWIGYLVIVIALLVLGSSADALLPMIAGAIVAALWLWTMPEPQGSRLTFWPAVVLALLCVIAVIWIGDRGPSGVIGDAWHLQTPFGETSFDLAMLVLGVFVFLLESSNRVVRAALAGEHAWHPADAQPAADAASVTEPSVTEPFVTEQSVTEPSVAEPQAAATARPAHDGGFKGGRLIGPLERVLVFMLTLAGAYSLIAATLAAKGIVRFPEISKDGETGARAEYFLVGSLVSWVIALGAAFLVWWAAHV